MTRRKTSKGLNRQRLRCSIRHKLKKEAFPFHRVVISMRFYLLCWPVFSPHMEGARFREAPLETISSSAEQRLKPPSLACGGPRMLSESKSNRRAQMSEEEGGGTGKGTSFWDIEVARSRERTHQARTFSARRSTCHRRRREPDTLDS